MKNSKKLKINFIKLFTSLTLLLYTKAINLLTDLPKTLTIGDKDIVGFNSKRFINGSQIEIQAYPLPYIKSKAHDNRELYIDLKKFLGSAQCTLTVSSKPLEFATICALGPTYYIVLFVYNQELKIKEFHYGMIGAKDTICSDLDMIDERVFVTCTKSGEGNGTSVDLQVHGFKKAENEGKRGMFTPLVKISDMKEWKEFTTKDALVHPLELISVRVSETKHVLMTYQKVDDGKSKIKPSSKLMIMSFDKNGDKWEAVIMKDGVFGSAIRKAVLMNGEWFSAQHQSVSTLMSCNFDLGKKNVQCSNSTFALPGGKFAAWGSKFNWYNKKSIAFMGSNKIFQRCIINKMPLDKKDLNCETINLYFTEDQLKSLIADDLRPSRNLNDIIVSYYTTIVSSGIKIISGYLKIDMIHQTASYKSLEHLQGRRITLLNASHYILNVGDKMGIYKSSLNQFTLMAPKKAKNASVFLSSFKPGHNGVKPISFSMKTQIKKMDSEFDNIELDPVALFTVYNDLSYHDFGVDAKLVRGNGVTVNINVKDNKVPMKTRFVENVKMVIPNLDDGDVKDVLLANGGYMIIQEDKGAKVLILDCKISETVLNSTCLQLFKNTLGQNINLMKVTKHKTGVYIIIKENEGKTSKMFLYNFVLEVDKKGKQILKKSAQTVIADFDSFCDMKRYGELIVTICSNNGPPASKGKESEIILKTILYNPDGSENVKKTKFYKVNPRKFDSPGFIKGDIQFNAGSNMMALAVNNDPKDLSILELEFDGLEEGIPFSLANTYLLKKPLNPKKNFDVDICQTLTSIFFYEKNTGYIYGNTKDIISGSYLEVPLNGENRVIEKMICSQGQESFQLVVRETSTNDRFLLSYYGFDGTQANKKLHSEHKIQRKLRHIASTTLDPNHDGIFLTYFYEKTSLFYNESILIDMNGPINYLKFDGVVAGKYEYTITLSNKKKKKVFKNTNPSKKVAEKIIGYHDVQGLH